MARLMAAVFVTGLLLRLTSPSEAADDKGVNAILDKAIKAKGGAEKLSKAKGGHLEGEGNDCLHG